MPIDITIASDNTYKYESFPIAVTVNNTTETSRLFGPLDEVWLYAIDSMGSTIRNSFRARRWHPEVGIHTYHWRDCWFRNERVGQKYRFVAALVYGNNTVYEVETTDIELRG